MKTKWFLSIRTKIVVVYIAVVSIVLIGMSAGFRNMLQEEAVSRSSALCRNTLQNITASIDAKLLLADDYRYTIYSDDSMVDALSHILPLQQRTSYQQYVYQTILRKGLIGYSHTSSFVNSFYLYSYKSDTLFSSNGYFILNDMAEADCTIAQAYDRIGDAKWVFLNADEPQVVSLQPIYDFYTHERLGLFSVNVSMLALENEIATHTPQTDMQICMVDSTGAAINASGAIDPAIREAKSGGVITMDGADYLVVSDASDYTGWTFYALLPMSTVLSSTTYINNVFFTTFFIVLFAFFVAAAVGAIYLYRPVKEIFNAMKKVEAGDLSVHLESRRKDEVGYIIFRFNQMVFNLNKQIQDNYVNQLLLREAQLINLYSQIDEHFLYNTLDAIKWAATYRDSNTVATAIITLSKYYRISLSDGRDVITVREALDQAEAYLDIQKFRLQDKLQYHIDADPEALDLPIIKYIMQPLVENCVVHGIGKRTEVGHINISVRRQPDTISFTISDDGVGISRSKLDDISARIERSDTKRHKYFALYTVNRLLKTFYSNEYRLHIESGEGLGTTYWFEIPIRQDHEGGCPDVQDDHR